MRLIKATVTAAQTPAHGIQRLKCEAQPARAGEVNEALLDAINYLDLGVAVAPGDTVLLNVTALDLALGTGGVAFVVPDAAAPTVGEQVAPTVGEAVGEQDAPTVGEAVGEQVAPIAERGRAFAGKQAAPATGHIMKLRYTPLQREVLSVEEQASPWHETMVAARSLEGAPVVCCELFSQAPLVAAAVKHRARAARVILCMTDEAALLLGFAELAAAAREEGLFDGIITCGQALGGDLEAVNLFSGLLAARHVLGADVMVTAMGPGIVGTATPFGHGGLAQAVALNAAAALDAVPIAVLRLSFADCRSRHQGLSHHTLTALGTATLTPAVIAFPDDLPSEQAQRIERALEAAKILERHALVRVATDANAIDLRGLEVTTMGRTQAEDPAFFSAAFAAGILAADLLADDLLAPGSLAPGSLADDLLAPGSLADGVPGERTL
ncbi:MAG: DUF3866 family protein [Coriobacteriales bacterium]|jgi:hypothetical protein|nr:DUF3866 family protein [Coriobacteriales bacterium]